MIGLIVLLISVLPALSNQSESAQNGQTQCNGGTVHKLGKVIVRVLHVYQSHKPGNSLLNGVTELKVVHQ